MLATAIGNPPGKLSSLTTFDPPGIGEPKAYPVLRDLGAKPVKRSSALVASISIRDAARWTGSTGRGSGNHVRRFQKRVAGGKEGVDLRPRALVHPITVSRSSRR